VKRRAIIEVLAVWSAIFLIVHTSHLNPLVRWSFRFSNWNYFSHVVYVALPVAVVLLSRRRLRDYGLTLLNWRSGLAWGGGIAAVMAVPCLAAHLAGWVAFDSSHDVLDTLLFQLIMAGFGEEILYRGYYQSRLNQGFGQPWNVLGLRFGWGLILASLVFGVDHMLNPFDPFRGHFGLDPWWGLGVLPGALMFALLRERTGSILAPAIVHGVEDVLFCFTAPGWTTWTVLSIGSGLAWSLFFALQVWSARSRSGRPHAPTPAVESAGSGGGL